MAKAKQTHDPTPAPENVTVITAPQAIAAYNAGDLDTVEQYCNIAGQNALKGIVAMRDELRSKQ